MQSIFREWGDSHPEKIAEALDRVPPGRLRTDPLRN